MRHDGLMKTVIEGQVDGKRSKGRSRMCYIGQIIKDVREKKYVSMKRLADRRERSGELCQINLRIADL